MGVLPTGIDVSCTESGAFGGQETTPDAPELELQRVVGAGIKFRSPARAASALHPTTAPSPIVFLNEGEEQARKKKTVCGPCLCLDLPTSRLTNTHIQHTHNFFFKEETGLGLWRQGKALAWP